LAGIEDLFVTIKQAASEDSAANTTETTNSTAATASGSVVSGDTTNYGALYGVIITFIVVSIICLLVCGIGGSLTYVWYI